MRFVLEALPGFALLYVTFLLGQVNQRRRYKDRRDPLPIIKASRNLVVASQLNEHGDVSPLAVKALEFALDEWDLKGK